MPSLKRSLPPSLFVLICLAFNFCSGPEANKEAVSESELADDKKLAVYNIQVAKIEDPAEEEAILGESNCLNTGCYLPEGYTLMTHLSCSYKNCDTALINQITFEPRIPGRGGQNILTTIVNNPDTSLVAGDSSMVTFELATPFTISNQVPITLIWSWREPANEQPVQSDTLSLLPCGN